MKTIDSEKIHLTLTLAEVNALMLGSCERISYLVETKQFSRAQAYESAMQKLSESVNV